MSEVNKLVINLLGSPGSGKSLAATSLFSKLKRTHLDTVLVTEFAHQLVVENRTIALADQLFVWANQNHRIFAGYRHASVVVTDSPILLGAIYNKTNPNLCHVILEEHGKYNNFNILKRLDSNHPYSMVGRIHDAYDSANIECDIVKLLTDNEIPFIEYDDYSEDDIVNIIVAALT